MRERTARLLSAKIGFIHNICFTRPAAMRDILASQRTDVPSGTSGDQRLPPDAPSYFASLYQTPLLDPVQETTLFQWMNFLKYRASQLRARLNPSRARANVVSEIERLLVEAARVRDRIVSANLRLVVSIARRFAGKHGDFEELISDGNLTLISTVEKFDYARGFRFSTYATHAIQRDFFRQVRRRQTNRLRFVQATEEMVATISNRESSDAGHVEQTRRRRQLAKLMEQELTERERYIVNRRYGLDHDSGKQTLATIGAELGVSKERVRQLEIQAIETLQMASQPQSTD